MAVIEYVYAAHSAFAYLGSARFMAIAAAAGRGIVHKPVDLHAVIDAVGSTPFRARSDAFREYFFLREIQRWSEERGASVFGRPTHHTNDITLANCMIVAGVEAGLNVDDLAHGCLEAHWRYDADLADHDTLVHIARKCGYEGQSLLEAAMGEAVRAAYAANTAEAIQRSVFGSPTYFFDGDMFYGQDRLEMVERALKRPYAKDWSGP